LRMLPVLAQQTHNGAIVNAMDVSRPRDKTDIERILRQVTENIQGRGMVVIVSDFLIDRQPLVRGLEMLCHRRHDILVFHLLDEDEVTFPFSGTTRFEGTDEQPFLLCYSRALRDGYSEALEENLIEVRRDCNRLGIDYHTAKT